MGRKKVRVVSMLADYQGWDRVRLDARGPSGATNEQGTTKTPKRRYLCGS